MPSRPDTLHHGHGYHPPRSKDVGQPAGDSLLLQYSRKGFPGCGVIIASRIFMGLRGLECDCASDRFGRRRTLVDAGFQRRVFHSPSLHMGSKTTTGLHSLTVPRKSTAVTLW